MTRAEVETFVSAILTSNSVKPDYQGTTFYLTCQRVAINLEAFIKMSWTLAGVAKFEILANQGMIISYKSVLCPLIADFINFIHNHLPDNANDVFQKTFEIPPQYQLFEL